MASSIKELVRKYVGDDVDKENLEQLFVGNSINLHTCVLMSISYPKLNDFLEFYLKTCDNVDELDCYGRSALNTACNYVIDMSFIRTIKIFINAGANVNLQDQFGATPMHTAFFGTIYRPFEETKKIIELLIMVGGDIFNIKDEHHKTACHYLSKKHLEYLQIDEATQTIGIKTGRLTKVAKK